MILIHSVVVVVVFSSTFVASLATLIRFLFGVLGMYLYIILREMIEQKIRTIIDVYYLYLTTL
jgi:hypothetical protein